MSEGMTDKPWPYLSRKQWYALLGMLRDWWLEEINRCEPSPELLTAIWADGFAKRRR